MYNLKAIKMPLSCFVFPTTSQPIRAGYWFAFAHYLNKYWRCAVHAKIQWPHSPTIRFKVISPIENILKDTYKIASFLGKKTIEIYSYIINRTAACRRSQAIYEYTAAARRLSHSRTQYKTVILIIIHLFISAF